MHRTSAGGNIQRYGGETGHVYDIENHSRVPFRTTAFRDTSEVHDTAQSGGFVVSYSVLGAAAFVAFFFGVILARRYPDRKNAVEQLKRQGPAS